MTKRVAAIENGDVCNVSLLSMGSHTGTHVDAPYHFLKEGPKLGEVPLVPGRRELDAWP